MNLVKHHPFNPTLFSGRAEPFENERACYWHELVNAYYSHSQDTGQKIGLVGFACDQGVRRNQGRVGAKHAPDVIRQAFGKLPCSVALLNKYGTDRNGELAGLIGDVGSVECLDNDELTADSLEQTHQAYADKITTVLNQGGFAIGLGGGHAIGYGSFLGLWQSLNEEQQSSQKIGVINFDPHLDIRKSDVATSGTPFRQIAKHMQNHARPFDYLCIGVSEFGNTPALFDRAEQLGVAMISDDDCYRLPFASIAKRIAEFTDQLDMIYMTIDMDCFSASTVPAVSATAAKGLPLDFVEQCIEQILATGKVKVADLAEINPQLDRDGISAKVAARLVAKIANQQLVNL